MTDDGPLLSLYAGDNLEIFKDFVPESGTNLSYLGWYTLNGLNSRDLPRWSICRERV
jgi:hypothetical protein